MNFFLDENFPKKASILLESRGHAVFDIRGSSNEGMDDNEIFIEAQQKKAVFLTTDRDFFHTVHLLFANHRGAVVIALAQPNGSRILKKLESALPTIEKEPMADTCLLLTDKKAFVSKK
jgi:predicted nuclease of predicted toxin-antitoxin system